MVFNSIGLAEGGASWSENYDVPFQRPEYETVKAKILEIVFDDTMIDKEDVEPWFDIRYQHLKIEILEGQHRGESYTVRNTVEMMNPQKLIFAEGEVILVQVTTDDTGSVSQLRIFDRYRSRKLFFMVLLFAALMIVIGGKKGFKSILSLLLTGVWIFALMIPLILKGFSPIIVAMITCIGVLSTSLLIISGKNKKTLTAFVGALVGLLVAVFMALVFGNWSQLSGVGDEYAQMIAMIPQKSHMNFKGILFSGIMIGAMGAVMDVTLSIASALEEICGVQSKINRRTLWQSGMNIGKDIMGSMSNTLILAYVGGAIHLMLIFFMFDLKVVEIANQEVIASEIIRAMAGSMGLIAAIPATAFVGSLLYDSNQLKKK